MAPDVIIEIMGAKGIGEGIVADFLASGKFLNPPAIHLNLPQDVKRIRFSLLFSQKGGCP